MNFEQLDQWVEYRFKQAKSNIDYSIKHNVNLARHKVEVNLRRSDMILRNLAYIERFPPYARMDINQMVVVTEEGWRNLLKKVPNTSYVELIPDNGQLKVELYTEFNERFKECRQLEMEYEFDMKYLINYIRPIGLYVDIKFIHHYCN